MKIKLYNTATKQKEEFVPLVEGKAGIYVCGVTVYDHSHIGHARSAIVFDVLVKYFRARGMDVTFVKNFTDVDDKIIKWMSIHSYWGSLRSGKITRPNTIDLYIMLCPFSGHISGEHF